MDKKQGGGVMVAFFAKPGIGGVFRSTRTGNVSGL